MKNWRKPLSFFKREQREEGVSVEVRDSCLFCGTDLSASELYERYRICHSCHFHYSLSARERVDLLIDAGTFKESNRSLVSLDPLSFSDRVSYRRRIFEAQRRTGLADAAVTGVGAIGGQPAVIVALDFSFMGGSMGCVVGEKVALAFEVAAKKKLPVVAVVSSGGARMQEGMLSLMQMAKTVAAAKRLHAAGLPFLIVLTNPTTGEVYASFANLGDVIVAEPHALVGFASLRAVEEATGKPLPEGSHTAEFQLEHGMIDLVIDRTKLRDLLSILLYLLGSSYRLTLAKKRLPYREPRQPPKSAWEEVQLARHEKRPTAVDYITRMTSGFVELHGDRLYGDDKSIVCGLAELSGQAVVVIGQERERGTSGIYPEGFRKAQRAMRLAAKFDLPVITLIDTPGAYPGLEAEERGVGEAIASTIALMSDLPVPIVSAVIGEGGGEGALAMGVADRVLMLENAIYSVISPEGAASIIYRDATKAEELALALKLTARDCRELEVVDVIVPEPEGGAHRDPEEAARQLKIFLVRELLEIQSLSPGKLLKARYRKYRRMGEYNSYFRAAIAREVNELQDYLQKGALQIKEHLPGKGKGRVPLENENNTLIP